MRQLLIIVVVASACLLSGCEELTEGFLAASQDAPAGHVAYVTRDGDTLYNIAKRYYDRGWMMGRIQEVNEGRLAQITREDGSLDGGHIIFLPPNLNGRPPKVTDGWHVR